MTDCPQRLGTPDGLHCTRDADDHQPGHGCTYEGSWVADRHDRKEEE